MIQNYTYMDVADNSGAKQAMCFHVLGGSKRRYASLGDVIVVAVNEAIPQATVKKGDVKVTHVGLAWVPFWVAGGGEPIPAYRA